MKREKPQLLDSLELDLHWPFSFIFYFVEFFLFELKDDSDQIRWENFDFVVIPKDTVIEVLPSKSNFTFSAR